MASTLGPWQTRVVQTSPNWWEADPLAVKVAKAAKLTPVDYDPFAPGAPKLTPVDYDPFQGQEDAFAHLMPGYNAPSAATGGAPDALGGSRAIDSALWSARRCNGDSLSPAVSR
jgi:hypothetical protein